MPLDLNRSRVLSFARRYGFALGLTGVAVAFRGALFPWLASDVPFLLLLGPLVVVTWYGGLGPGMLSAVLSFVVGIYYFLPPYGTWSFTRDSGIHAGVFGIECAVMTALTSIARASNCRTKDTARHMTAIYKISAELGSTRSVDDIAAVILDEAIRLLGADGIALYIGSESTGALRLEGIFSGNPRWLPQTGDAEFKEIPIDRDVGIALAARSREVVAFENDEQRRQRFPKTPSRPDRPVPPAVIHAPMLVHGETVGIFTLVWGRPRRFSEADLSWARGVAQDCAHAVERTRLFEAERRERMEAEDARRAQEAFFSSVSHELRAPLMSIVEWAHTLNNGRRLDRAFQKHGLEIIESGAQAQIRLIDDVIEMARVPARPARVKVKSAEIAVLVRSWLDDVRDEAEKKGVTLEMGPQAKAGLAADIGRLRVAMRKVMADAIEGSPRGGKVQVDSEARGDDRVCVRVRHPGSGRVEGPLDEEHFGLNLAIANVAVRQHGGAISVDRAKDGGTTTVTVELPGLDPMAGLLATSSRAAAEATVPLAGARVLLVDDDAEVREVLGHILSADGAEVRSEASAQAGLEAVSEFAPTVIVSDIEMPEHDGCWFIRAVRALPASVASVPALALTSRGGKDDGQVALDAGFQQRIAKPPHPQALSDAIAQMLAPRRTA